MKAINLLKRKILIKKELSLISSYKDRLLIDSEIEKQLTAQYNEYVRNISTPEMALSLELALFIYKFLEKNQSKKILDLGSGFSSYVLRLYKKSNDNVEVHSVDDNEQWLKETEKYLTTHSLPVENLHTLEDFVKSSQSNTFDFVLLDLNFVEVRKDYLDFSVKLLSDNGILIIDDTHKVEFLREVIATAKKYSGELLSLRKATLDSFGRFSLLYQNRP